MIARKEPLAGPSLLPFRLPFSLAHPPCTGWALSQRQGGWHESQRLGWESFQSPS